MEQTDLRGDDIIAIIPSSADPSLCTTLCCNYISCLSWSYAAEAPTNFINCKKDQPCCYLKHNIPQPSHNPAITSGIMNRISPYIYPPSGLRSSIPIGGVTTGSIELRGDGTFHEWTVESQSPAGGVKYGLVDDTLLGHRSIYMNVITQEAAKREVQSSVKRSHK